MKKNRPGARDKERQYLQLREEMVEKQLAARGIVDDEVLNVMGRVPRHRFVPEDLRNTAYDDKPVPLGPGQSVSQPYIVAYMLQEARLTPTDKVLEIGTGSGYQAALLAELVKEVHSIEIDHELVEKAQSVLLELGYSKIHLHCGNGFNGVPEEAPFNVIIVAAASETVPRELIRQLAPNGRLILPLGDGAQELVLFEKTAAGLTSRELGGVQFVPLVGEEK